eukprot:1031690-Rhodomonas_salina.1
MAAAQFGAVQPSVCALPVQGRGSVSNCPKDSALELELEVVPEAICTDSERSAHICTRLLYGALSHTRCSFLPPPFPSGSPFAISADRRSLPGTTSCFFVAAEAEHQLLSLAGERRNCCCVGGKAGRAGCVVRRLA